MPKRIQLRRTRGWKMPPNTCKVDRTTKFGNPFKVGMESHEMDSTLAVIHEERIRTPEQAIEMYRWWLTEVVKLDVSELRGKDLACWCKPGAPCHADVLLEIANKE